MIQRRLVSALAISAALLAILATVPALADGHAYLTELRERIAAINDRLPQIVQAGEALAEHFDRHPDADDPGLVVLGNNALAHELGNRAGSVFNYDVRTAPRPGDAAILTTPTTLTVALPDGTRCTIDLPVPPPGRHDPARPADAPPARPSADPPARFAAPLQAAAAHAVMLEAFAAATRLGRVPVVRESLDTDTRRDRFFRVLGQRFHRDRWLDPIDPGTLAPQYLDNLADRLLDLQTASGGRLDRAADRVKAARFAGDTVYLVAGPHGLPHHLAALAKADPDFPFVLLTDAHAVGQRDLVLAFADYQHAGDYDYFPQIDQMRKTRDVVWLLNAHNTYRHDRRRSETVVDLRTPVGDADVRVEMYDCPLGPTSGVVTLAAYHFLAAEAVTVP
ncbi:MAG: hypothetical protein AAF586_09915 [Planctomycetota bacterium]